MTWTEWILLSEGITLVLLTSWLIHLGYKVWREKRQVKLDRRALQEWEKQDKRKKGFHIYE